ncbi:hypothetical protein [Nocardia sp. NPDC004722]
MSAAMVPGIPLAEQREDTSDANGTGPIALMQASLYGVARDLTGAHRVFLAYGRC